MIKTIKTTGKRFKCFVKCKQYKNSCEFLRVLFVPLKFGL
jgi:hypothetical protein